MVSTAYAAKSGAAAPSGFTTSSELPEEMVGQYPASDASLAGMSVSELQQLYGITSSAGVGVIDKMGDLSASGVDAVQTKFSSLEQELEKNIDPVKIEETLQSTVDNVLAKEQEYEQKAADTAADLERKAAESLVKLNEEYAQKQAEWEAKGVELQAQMTSGVQGWLQANPAVSNILTSGGVFTGLAVIYQVGKGAYKLKKGTSGSGSSSEPVKIQVEQVAGASKIAKPSRSAEPVRVRH